MNPAVSQPLPLPERTLRDLDLGCRIGFLVLTLILGYIAVRLSWSFSAGSAHLFFTGMLKGAPIPLSLQIAQSTNSPLISLSAALPVVAGVAAYKVRSPLTALLVISGCNLVLALISILLGTAIMDALGQVMEALV
ncbi:hypothetical protein [Rariglobus hedericola]|uniref:Uncharacterized protein n=1 Tax=Rariglobus hedericola TaxID=2597822 RepID=A0A556QJ74_9BACT|nr:hypothetical protein [Rariglobus hedericola]TSJ76686.1 hypothetical protein FPL22_11205 [Rariglobus hedericola]